jgi:hypothetical protein
MLKLEITGPNDMEGFQRELRRHIKQYDAIQGSKWKKDHQSYHHTIPEN